MGDMDESMAVALERVAGGVSRVEVKIDTALADLQRRMESSEQDRQALHGRVTEVVGRTSGLESRMDGSETRLNGIEARVGGAFSKFAPVVVSVLSLGLAAIVFATQW